MGASGTGFTTAEKRWAGIGPYYAMFPSAFCDAVIRKYSSKGDTVLDPFAGRGTALYSAAIAGRRPLGIEVNPVGWVYALAKLSPASRADVEQRLVELRSAARRYSREALEMPLFFRRCFSPEVRRFLLCARSSLNWRQNRADRTLMALLLVHLHGKASDSLSNQMRQTKAMSPKYSVLWWERRGLRPPRIDPLEFMRGKLDWRYAKGRPTTANGRVYLGDSTSVLSELAGNLSRLSLTRPSLLLTSPPYRGVTNYHYDQWLRLWLLGGPASSRRTHSRYNGKYRRKFEDQEAYSQLLSTVFEKAARLMRRDGVVYVRTDSRQPTLTITKAALKAAFTSHRLKQAASPIRGRTQTRLFGNGDPRAGEVDLILTP